MLPGRCWHLCSISADGSSVSQRPLGRRIASRPGGQGLCHGACTTSRTLEAVQVSGRWGPPTCPRSVCQWLWPLVCRQPSPALAISLHINSIRLLRMWGGREAAGVPVEHPSMHRHARPCLPPPPLRCTPLASPAPCRTPPPCPLLQPGPAGGGHQGVRAGAVVCGGGGRGG